MEKQEGAEGKSTVLLSLATMSAPVLASTPNEAPPTTITTTTAASLMTHKHHLDERLRVGVLFRSLGLANRSEKWYAKNRTLCSGVMFAKLIGGKSQTGHVTLPPFKDFPSPPPPQSPEGRHTPPQRSPFDSLRESQKRPNSGAKKIASPTTQVATSDADTRRTIKIDDDDDASTKVVRLPTHRRPQPPPPLVGADDWELSSKRRLERPQIRASTDEEPQQRISSPDTLFGASPYVDEETDDSPFDKEQVYSSTSFYSPWPV